MIGDVHRDERPGRVRWAVLSALVAALIAAGLVISALTPATAQAREGVEEPPEAGEEEPGAEPEEFELGQIESCEGEELSLAAAEHRTLQLVNEARAEEGLEELCASGTLTEAARGHADYLLQTGEISHEGRPVQELDDPAEEGSTEESSAEEGSTEEGSAEEGSAEEGSIEEDLAGSEDEAGEGLPEEELEGEQASNPAQRMVAAGYEIEGDDPDAFVWAENVTWGAGERAGADVAFEEMMADEEHRTNVLDERFTELGVGAYSGEFADYDEVGLYVLDFAGRTNGATSGQNSEDLPAEDPDRPDEATDGEAISDGGEAQTPREPEADEPETETPEAETPEAGENEVQSENPVPGPMEDPEADENEVIEPEPVEPGQEPDETSPPEDTPEQETPQTEQYRDEEDSSFDERPDGEFDGGETSDPGGTSSTVKEEICERFAEKREQIIGDLRQDTTGPGAEIKARIADRFEESLLNPSFCGFGPEGDLPTGDPANDEPMTDDTTELEDYTADGEPVIDEDSTTVEDTDASDDDEGLEDDGS